VILHFAVIYYFHTLMLCNSVTLCSFASQFIGKNKTKPKPAAEISVDAMAE
jgi:hypothetical protein